MKNVKPQIKIYIAGKRTEERKTPGQKVAGVFYYSSWLFIGLAAAVLFWFLLNVQMNVLPILIYALIFGLPHWMWALIGIILFTGYRKHFKSGLDETTAKILWIGTMLFNAIQAVFVFAYLTDYRLAVLIGFWNCLAFVLALAALFFELEESENLS